MPSPIMAPMTFAVFYRDIGGKLCVVTDDDGEPREFSHRDAAIAYTDRTVLPESDDVDYQIVELDEL
jgi:hypothetical protein